ncbi:MAG: SRPBCC family protein [Betaproteobacteria bacterium]
MKRTAQWILLAAGLWIATIACAATITARHEGEAVIVEAVDELAVTPEQAWAVLTDYEGLVRFIPDMLESRVIIRNGNSVMVEQKGRASLFLLHRPVEVRLEIVESPYQWVTSKAISGSFKEMVGRYDLKPEGGMLRFTYTGRIVPDFWLPALFETAAIRHAIGRQFAAMVKEIRRRAAEGQP